MLLGFASRDRLLIAVCFVGYGFGVWVWGLRVWSFWGWYDTESWVCVSLQGWLELAACVFVVCLRFAVLGFLGFVF